jgi:hypothetical protein
VSRCTISRNSLTAAIPDPGDSVGERWDPSAPAGAVELVALTVGARKDLSRYGRWPLDACHCRVNGPCAIDGQSRDQAQWRLGVSRSRVALAWLLSQPGITAPIIGSAKPGHLAEAVAALSVTLNATDRAELEAPYVPHAASFY